MKSLCLSLLVAISLNTCTTDLNNSAWEVSKMRIRFNNSVKTKAINQMIDNDLKNGSGNMIVVFNDKKIHQFKGGKIDTTFYIHKIKRKQITYKDGDKTSQIEYDLSNEGKLLKLSYTNGSSMELQRISYSEKLKRKVSDLED